MITLLSQSASFGLQSVVVDPQNGGYLSNQAIEILNFKTVRATMIKISEWVDITTILNLTKIEGSELGGCPQMGPFKIQTF